MDLGELYNSYKDNHASRRDTQHPSTNKQMHTRTRQPITSRPSHRRISTRDAYRHKATSTRIATSHRRISTRGAHRLTVHDNNNYARPAGSHQVTAESVHAWHIHTRRPVTHHASHRRVSTRGAHRMRQYTITTLTPLRRDRTNLPPPRSLIRVSNTRGRVLCSKFHGEYCLPLLPVVRGTEDGRLKGQRYCPAMHR